MAKTTKYTNGNGDRDAQNAANFDNGAPVTGDTIQFDNTEGDLTGGTLPNNWPGSETYNIEILANYDCQLDFFVTDQNTLGTVLVNSSGANILQSVGYTTATVTDGTLYDDNSYDVSGNVVLNGGTLMLDNSVQDGTVTDTGAGTLYIQNSAEVTGNITLTASDLEIDGNADLTCGGTVTNETAGQIIAVDTGATGPRKIIGNVAINAGGTMDWSVDSETFTIEGSFVVVNGVTLTSGGYPLYQAGTGNFGNPDSSERFHYRIVSGATITVTTNFSSCLSLIIADGTASFIAAAARDFYVVPTGNDYLSVPSGSMTGTNLSLFINSSGNRTNSGDVTCNNLRIEAISLDREMTFSGVVNIDTLIIDSAADNKHCKFIATGASFTAPSLTLGVTTGTDRHGELDVDGVSGTVTIGNLASGDTGLSNALELGDSDVSIPTGSTWDGSDITCTADGDNQLTGDTPNPTIQDCVFDNLIYADDCEDGDGNVNINFGGVSGTGTTTRTAA